jgi:hypothetical protein
VKLVLRQKNDPILPPGASRAPGPSTPLSPPFQAPPPPSVSTEEELERAFLKNKFIDISSDRSSSGDDIIEDLEERDISGTIKMAEIR